MPAAKAGSINQVKSMDRQLQLSASVFSLICKVYELLGKHKKRILAVFFFILEATSVAFDQLGQRTIAATESEAERQLLVLEIVFSSVQLIATSLHFTMTVLLGVTNKYNTSIFPLAFSIVALVFVFRKDEKVNDPQITNTLPTGPIASLNSVENQQVPDGSHVRRRQLNGLQNIENLNDLRRFAST